MFVDDEKTRQVLRMLESEHFRYRRKEDTASVDNEVDLSSGWSIEIDAPASPLIARMEQDFRSFMHACMDVEFNSPSISSHRLRFRLTNEFQTADESFELDITRDEVQVSASNERGLLQASHYIERFCSRRGGPFLGVGKTRHCPTANPRIAQSAFYSTPCRLDDLLLLTDKYLSLLSHFGVNGVHVDLSIWECVASSVFPELTPSEWKVNAGHLQNLCERAAVFGIDIYAVVYSGIHSADSSVFLRNPDIRGALLNYPVPGDRYCLCSSNPVVIGAYQELLKALFTDAPMLRGAILLVGGEGFVHCFTRPKPPLDGNTCCPRCAGRSASHDVASLMNHLAGSIHRVRPDALVFTWPYSAFTWSGDDFAQEEFIRHLSPDVQVLSNFETPDVFSLEGANSALIDYNIVSLGPSKQFETQSRVLAGAGKSHYAKFESTVEPGWHFLPYLPVHYRWIERIKRLKSSGVGGYVSKWKFYGVTDSLPEELLCEAGWGDVDESTLAQIAARDFGECPTALLEGWKILSEVWEKIPACHMLYGEREFYMKGPAYLGPAHPLIFDTQKRYDLIDKFFQLRGDAGEMMEHKEVAEINRSAPPRYSSDLLFVHPFGVDASQARFEEVLREWNSGVEKIRGAFGESPTQRAQIELGICEIVGIHLQTILNVIRFYRLRDSLFVSPSNEDDLRCHIDELIHIIDDEVDNARRALPILESDPRIGWGHAYGQVYDTQMVEDKIRQCLYIRNVELPEITSGILFHVYGKYEVS